MDKEIIFTRQNPHYRKNKACWQRCFSAYSGGQDYIAQALVKHVSEIDIEYLERLNRACYFNYPRKIARLITQYLLSVEPQRENADPELADDFSRTGLRVNEIMRQFSTVMTVFGGAAILVEMPYFTGELDPERKKKERIRPAARVLSPLDIPDWAFGADGKLAWMITADEIYPDNGPFAKTERIFRRTLWTRKEYFVFEKDHGGNIAVTASGQHGLDCVPALYFSEPESFGIHANHYFEDLVRISEAILNNESEAQMNIVKQMFGLLVVSDSFARGARLDSAGQSSTVNSSSAPKFSHLIARSAAICESPEERGISRYISPSGADIGAIRDENTMLKKELFDIAGLAQPVMLNQAQTAEAKSWDNHQVRQFLISRVDLMEQAEMATWELFRRFDRSIAIPKVVYNRDFAVTDLQNAVKSLLQLKQISGSERFSREIAKTALFLLERMKKIDPADRNRILAEIENAGKNSKEAENV